MTLERQISRSYPAIVHAAVFSALVLPIALLPYFATRRRIVKLGRTVQTLERDIRYLKHAVDLTVSSLDSAKAELKVVQSMSQSAIAATAEVQRETIKHEDDRRISDRAIQADLRKLLDNAQHMRTQAATLRALGMSLAEVAAFMQEIELDLGMGTQGNDRRGIERLRLLALRMQSLNSLEQDKDKSKPGRNQT